jgi:glycosyltransferase involved in cell wall biosynthesis
MADLDPGLQAHLPIAVISHAHPSISKGGAEIAAFTLFRGLRMLGVPAVFIAAVPMAARDRLDLQTDEHAVFYNPQQYDHLYQLGEAGALAQLRRILKQTGARLLNFHHFMNFGVNAMRELALEPAFRTVLTIHEFLAICHHHGQMVTKPHQGLCIAASNSACGACFPDLGWRRLHLRASLFQDSFAAIDHFISPSQFLVDRFAAWGLLAARMEVIENGLARAVPVRQPPRPAVEKPSWIFGYFGQVTPFKGVDVLLNAAERLAKMPGMPERIEIRISGNAVGISEAFSKRLKELSETLPFVRFLGPYENDGVLDLMAECDYVLTPSVWWENSPVVIQEAYAAGRPVICTGIGGMAEKVRDGVSGLHFRRGDAVDLARVIAVAADGALYARLQAGIPEPYDTVEMARRYLTAFINTIHGAAPGNTAPQRLAPPSRAVGTAAPQAALQKQPKLMEQVSD